MHLTLGLSVLYVQGVCGRGGEVELVELREEVCYVESLRLSKGHRWNTRCCWHPVPVPSQYHFVC